MKKNFNGNNEQFKKECKCINLKYEYEGYHGKEQWAIVTELPEGELFERYPDEIKPYIPFVLLTVEQGQVISDFKRNEDKFRKRSQNKEDLFGYDDEITERFHAESIVPDFVERQSLEEQEEERYRKKMELIEKAVASLTEKQRKYLMARFVDNKSAREIAREEGVSHQVVDRHLIAAVKKFEKYFEGFF